MISSPVENTAVIILTLLLSAFFSGMEIAFFTSNKLKIEIDRGKGLLPARILHNFVKHPSRFIGVLLLGNNIALVIFGIAAAGILGPWLAGHFPSLAGREYMMLLLQTLIATVFILFFAEFLPKVLFRINANKILNALAIPLWVIYIIFYPLVYLFIGLSELILQYIFRMDMKEKEYVFSVVDLDDFLKRFIPAEPETSEVKQEIQMFQNAIEFRNVKLRECMVPRTEIVAVEERDPIEGVMHKFVDNGYSKILVYRDTIDNIVGYVHSFDLFKAPVQISDVIKPIQIVPETMLASHVMTQFIQQHKSVAVVVDEFGGTSGMVTMEDIIEEIFGEIEDEFDEDELVEEKLNDFEYIFSARLEIDYLNDEYDLRLPESEDYETLAGLIIQYHASIPMINQRIVVPPFEFTIMSMDEARIEKVRLRITGEG